MWECRFTQLRGKAAKRSWRREWRAAGVRVRGAGLGAVVVVVVEWGWGVAGWGVAG
jgi:hypothetical protein